MSCQGRHRAFDAELEFLFVSYSPPKPGGFYATRIRNPRCTACGDTFQFEVGNSERPPRVEDDFQTMSIAITPKETK